MEYEHFLSKNLSTSQIRILLQPNSKGIDNLLNIKDGPIRK